MARYRVTVDTGGTFSDFVYLNEETGEISIGKVPSTPDDPSRAILAGIELLLARGVQAADIGFFCHGTTVGTNALLEGKGAAHRPPGHRGLSRHLPGGRAGATLRPRDLRRDLRQAGAAGSAEPDRRSQGTRGFPRDGAAPARRGRAAGDAARRLRRKASSRSPCACCSRFSTPSTRRASARSFATSCPAAASRSRPRCCRRYASTIG